MVASKHTKDRPGSARNKKFERFIFSTALIFILALPLNILIHSIFLRSGIDSVFIIIALKSLPSIVIVSVFLRYFRNIRTDYNVISLLIFVIFSVLYVSRILYAGLFEDSLYKHTWEEYIFLFVVGVFIPAFLGIRFNRHFLQSPQTGFYFIIALTILNAYNSVIFYSQIGNFRFTSLEFVSLNPLAVGYAGALLLGILVVKVALGKPTQRELLVICCAASMSIVPLSVSGSRGPVAALLVTIVIIALKVRWKGKLVLALLAFLFVTWFATVQMYTDDNRYAGLTRLANTISGVPSEHGDNIRSTLWAAGLEEFSENPWVGTHLELRSYGDSHPHNILVESLFATGILGGLLMATMFLMGFYRAYTTVHDATFSWLAVCLLQASVQTMFSGAIWGHSWYFLVLSIFIGTANSRLIRHSRVGSR